MSQKYIKTQNKNNQSAAYGKYYAQAVYDTKFIETEELASFIQTQASVKKSDIIAVLQELGEAMKHFFELGQKIHLKGIGIFKVGFSAIGVTKKEDCSAATITTRRVLFQPETERVVVGQEKKEDGSIKQKYVIAKTLIKDVVFEETHDNSMNVEPESGTEGGQNGGSGSGSESGGSQSEPLAAPTISGKTSFSDSTTVSLSGPDGADIYYTLDGSTPTAESTMYTEEFGLSDTTTVKAIAILNGVSSEVASKTFTKI